MIEKILAVDEALEPTLPVAGTTGYDALREVGGLFVDPSGAEALTALYESTGVDYSATPAVLRDLKTAVTTGTLGSETARLRRAIVAAVGTVFAAGYLLWMLQKVAFGEPKPEFANAHIHDVTTFEWTAWIPILTLIVALGVFPNLVFHVTDPAVTHVTNAIASVIK